MWNVNRVFTVPVSAWVATRLKTLIPHVKLITMVIMLALLTACGAKKDPEPQITTVIEVAVVQMCLDTGTGIRQPNEECADQNRKYTWVYLVDLDEKWPAYIPAAGQFVERGRWQDWKPDGVDIELAPNEGAYFAR